MMEENEFFECCVCRGESSGAHKCKTCKEYVHPICGIGDEEEEGYGGELVCNNCLNEQGGVKENVSNVTDAKKAKPTSSEGNVSKNAFDKMILAGKRLSSNEDSASVKPAKRNRTKGGHERTKLAFCMSCYADYTATSKRKFWLSRFNPSTTKLHIGQGHKGITVEVYSEEDPRAGEAFKLYNKIHSEPNPKAASSSVGIKKKAKPKSKGPLKKPAVDIKANDRSAKQDNDNEFKACNEEQDATNKEINSTLEPTANATVGNIDEEGSTSLSTEETGHTSIPPSIGETPSSSVAKRQVSLYDVSKPDDSVPVLQGLGRGELQSLATMIAEKVKKAMQGSEQGTKKIAKTPTSAESGEIMNAPGSKASNILEFLQLEKDVELVDEGNITMMRCKICSDYLNLCPGMCGSYSKGEGGSLSKGLALKEDFAVYKDGHNETWFRLKHRVLRHLYSSDNKTHLDAVVWWRHSKATRKRQTIVTENIIRTALGVVKSKAAALQFEVRLAELFAAGADVGDYCHSRNLFNDILMVATRYIDKEVEQFLTSPLASTGMPPHVLITADKSTNHHIQNQVTVALAVVDGQRKAIPLSLKPVYIDTTGTGGNAAQLAEKIFEDLGEHTGLKRGSERILQVQGRVFDGQYLCKPFIDAINKPFFDLIQEKKFCNDLWWPVQWDPAHLIDLAFKKHKKDEFISRLIQRTNLVHSIFGYGKMHSLAKATAEELQLPFRVTVSFAQQRFLSSSYHQFLKLEKSIEVYVETFKDHNNTPAVLYQIAGQDFLYDLMGVIDLLRPLVLLQLKGQALMCPGWKFFSWTTLAIQQLEKFSQEIRKTSPSKSVCPYISKHGKQIKKKMFGKATLVDGWMLVGGVTGDTDSGESEDGNVDSNENHTHQRGNEKDGNLVSAHVSEDEESEEEDSEKEDSEEEQQPEEPNFEWRMRQVKDCKSDLSDFANKLATTFKQRCESMPGINKLLSRCLDFAMLVDGLCGENQGDRCPVNRNQYGNLGQSSFRQCIGYVSSLPHVTKAVVEQDLELGNAFADQIYWRLKSTLIEVIWGKHFQLLFPEFFKKVVDQESKLLDVKLKKGVTVTSLQKVVDDKFDLNARYDVVLSDKSTNQVALQENAIIAALYTNSSFYESVGQEFCIVFDILFAKTGTEAPAESHYRVVENQEKDGGQMLSTLSMRSRIDSCFPATVQCSRPIKEIAELYLKGDRDLGLKKHQMPVYKDARSVKLSNKGMSKVIKRHAEKEAPLSFLL